VEPVERFLRHVLAAVVAEAGALEDVVAITDDADGLSTTLTAGLGVGVSPNVLVRVTLTVVLDALLVKLVAEELTTDVDAEACVDTGEGDSEEPDEVPVS